MQFKLRFNPLRALALAAIPTLIVWSVGAAAFSGRDIQTVSVVLTGLGLVWIVSVAWAIIENITIVEDTEDERG